MACLECRPSRACFGTQATSCAERCRRRPAPSAHRQCVAGVSRSREAGQGGRSSADEGPQVPVVVPDAVLPPPPTGSQLAGSSAWSASSSSPGGGWGGGGPGRRGGVFTMFGDGDSGDDSSRRQARGAPGPMFGGAFHRVRLLLLSLLWASCSYLIVSSAGRCVGWLNQQLGITRALGFGPGRRAGNAHTDDIMADTAAGVEGVAEMVAAGSLAAAPQQSAGAGAAAGAGLHDSTAYAPGVPGQGQGAAPAAEVVGGQELDPQTRAQLKVLKDYERRRALGPPPGGDTGLFGHTGAAYLMILGTFGLFFVMK